MINWKNRKLGLVLSGGGAKGAYQVGMFRALEELGLSGNIRAISGCSIGAIDAAIYMSYGYEAVYLYLLEFGQLYEAAKRLTEQETEQARAAVASGLVPMGSFIAEKRFHQCDTSGFQSRILKTLTDQKLEKLNGRLYVDAYCLERGQTEYFLLNGMEAQKQRDLILASGSLPFVFPPVEYEGSHYLDGGVIPSICPNGAPADKIPLQPLLNEDVDAILVNFLIASDETDHRGLRPGVDYLELRPSRPLEAFPGAGTLDFSPEKLQSHEALGYADTLALFGGMI